MYTYIGLFAFHSFKIHLDKCMALFKSFPFTSRTGNPWYKKKWNKTQLAKGTYNLAHSSDLYACIGKKR